MTCPTKVVLEEGPEIAEIAARCCQVTCPDCGAATKLFCASLLLGGCALTFRCDCGTMLRMNIVGIMLQRK